MIAERLRIGPGNRYEILEPVAIGGMATVFQMRHRLHGGLFAVKVLHPWLAEETEFRSRFRTEAMHGAILAGHPHVVPVIDLAEIDGLFYMVMPYIEGEDLDRILQRTGPLQRSEVLILASHIAGALAAAEANGIVHGDVSSGNIRLDRYGNYRLMDFGLSQSTDTKAQKFTRVARTPSCTSPEQWRGERADIRSDLYSLGVVLLEALTGSAPFPGRNEAEIRQQHLAGDWRMPAAIDEDVSMAALLRSLLAKNRESRMQSPMKLAETLALMGFSLPEFRNRPELPATAHKRAALRDRPRRIS
jgi:serine/threonine protein kinase